MKKYFQFNGTINGTTYFLRMLFTIVLSIPFLIIIFAFFGMFAIEYAEIDMQNPESFDQQALEEKIQNNPDEFFCFNKCFHFILGDFNNYFVNPCCLVFISCIL